MRTKSTTLASGIGVFVAVLVGGLHAPVSAQAPADAGRAMPVAEQNALVQKHCAVCHTDKARSGGLSLQHFDGAQAAPSLAAMMLSKITQGVPMATVRRAAADPDAAATVERKSRNGAMNAAGIPKPPKETIDALIATLALQAAGTEEWSVERTAHPATGQPAVTASIVRELVSPTEPANASLYRLIVSCTAATRDGGMQLAWSPVPMEGLLSTTIDGQTRVTHKVEGKERMPNGTLGISGPAAIMLSDSRGGPSAAAMPLPARTLAISDLFPNQSVEFPFATLPSSTRQELAPCFAARPVAE